MNKNEQDFINYYFRNVVGKPVNASTINEAYFILRGERVTDDCNQCIKNRKQGLDNTYISLIKVGRPVEPVKKSFGLEDDTLLSNKVGSLDVIVNKKKFKKD